MIIKSSDGHIHMVSGSRHKVFPAHTAGVAKGRTAADDDHHSVVSGRARSVTGEESVAPSTGVDVVRPHRAADGTSTTDQAVCEALRNFEAPPETAEIPGTQSVATSETFRRQKSFLAETATPMQSPAAPDDLTTPLPARLAASRDCLEVLADLFCVNGAVHVERALHVESLLGLGDSPGASSINLDGPVDVAALEALFASSDEELMARFCQMGAFDPDDVNAVAQSQARRASPARRKHQLKDPRPTAIPQAIVSKAARRMSDCGSTSDAATGVRTFAEHRLILPVDQLVLQSSIPEAPLALYLHVLQPGAGVSWSQHGHVVVASAAVIDFTTYVDMCNTHAFLLQRHGVQKLVECAARRVGTLLAPVPQQPLPDHSPHAARRSVSFRGKTAMIVATQRVVSRSKSAFWLQAPMTVSQEPPVEPSTSMSSEVFMAAASMRLDSTSAVGSSAHNSDGDDDVYEEGEDGATSKDLRKRLAEVKAPPRHTTALPAVRRRSIGSDRRASLAAPRAPRAKPPPPKSAKPAFCVGHVKEHVATKTAVFNPCTLPDAIAVPDDVGSNTLRDYFISKPEYKPLEPEATAPDAQPEPPSPTTADTEPTLSEAGVVGRRLDKAVVTTPAPTPAPPPKRAARPKSATAPPPPLRPSKARYPHVLNKVQTTWTAEPPTADVVQPEVGAVPRLHDTVMAQYRAQFMLR